MKYEKIEEDIFMKTTAMRIHGVRDLRIDTFELPEIQEDELLVKVMALLNIE